MCTRSWPATPSNRWPTVPTAIRGCGVRSPPPTTSTTRCACGRAARSCCRHRRSWAVANQHFSSSLLVEVDGQPLPADLELLLTYAMVDDSRQLPDRFLL